MVCKYCGCENLEGALTCVYCGEMLPRTGQSVENIMSAFAGVTVETESEELAYEEGAAGMTVLSAARRLRQPEPGRDSDPQEEIAETVEKILEEAQEEPEPPMVSLSDQAAAIVDRAVKKIVGDEEENPEAAAPEAAEESAGEEAQPGESPEEAQPEAAEEEPKTRREQPEESPFDFSMQEAEEEAEPEPEAAEEAHNFVLAAAEAVPAAQAVSVKDLASREEPAPERKTAGAEEEKAEDKPGEKSGEDMPSIAMTKTDELIREAREEAREAQEQEQALIRKKLESAAGGSTRSHKQNRGAFWWVVLLFLLGLGLMYFFWLQPMLRYNDAVRLMESGNYRQALSLFEQGGNYKDSRKLADECIAKLGEDVTDPSQPHTEPTLPTEPVTTAPPETSPSETVPPETDPSESATADSSETETQPVETTTEEVTTEAPTEPDTQPVETTTAVIPRTINRGDIVSFGFYDQDGNAENGSEAIEWIVLEVEEDRVLLISRYILDAARFANPARSTNYAGSDIRNWLNNDFKESAFSSAQQEVLLSFTVDPGKNESHPAVGQGQAVEDKVGILSIEQIYHYFPGFSDRQCRATERAADNGVFRAGNGFSPWWTCTMGANSIQATLARSDGDINFDGRDLSLGTFGARPVICLSRDALD